MKLGVVRLSSRVRRYALVLALLSASCTKTTYEVVPAAGVKITGSTADLQPGDVVQLTAQVVSANGNVLPERTITWSSSAEAVAAVDATGRVTGRTPGSVTITASSEGVSAQRSYTVRSAVPTVTSIFPTTVLPNTAFELTVQGTGFYDGSVVRWNGASRPTTFVSATELRAAIPTTDLTVQGTVSITVVNASPGGGTSNAASLIVRPADPCQYLPPYAIGGSVSGALDSTDCLLSDGSYSDVFALSVGSTQAVTFRMSSLEVDPFLILTNAAGDRVLALNDDAEGLDSGLTILMAAGSYRLHATTAFENEVGPYTLTSETVPGSVSACGEYWITAGVQTDQNLTTTDCATEGAGGSWYGDRYNVYLAAGESITVRMTSTEVDAYLLILEGDTYEELAADDDSAGNGNAELTFTASADGVYVIEASTFSTEETGAYTLMVR